MCAAIVTVVQVWHRVSDAQMCTNSKLVASPAFIHMLPCTIHVLGNSSKTTYCVQVRHMYIFLQLPQVFASVQPRHSYVRNPGTYSYVCNCSTFVICTSRCKFNCCVRATQFYVLVNSGEHSYSLQFLHKSVLLCKSVAYVRACATPARIHIFAETLTRIRATLARIRICATPAHIYLAQLQVLVHSRIYAYWPKSDVFSFFVHLRPPFTYLYKLGTYIFWYSSSTHTMLCIFAQLRLLFRAVQPWHIFFPICANRTDTGFKASQLKVA